MKIIRISIVVLSPAAILSLIRIFYCIGIPAYAQLAFWFVTTGAAFFILPCWIDDFFDWLKGEE